MGRRSECLTWRRRYSGGGRARSAKRPWQVIPAAMGKLMGRDPKRVMEALLKMGKIDIEGLRRAGGQT